MTKSASAGAGRRLRSWLGVAGTIAILPLPAMSGQQPGADAKEIPCNGYEIVQTWPHDRTAFTEGLTFSEGMVLESTGLNGHSELRRIDLASGRVTQSVPLPEKYFGEGTTALGGRIYQLTWKNETGFVYDEATLKLRGTFTYSGEGWGLTTDGHSLIMSDGTNRIRFIDPQTFATLRTIEVRAHGQPVMALNELEYVKGEIYANVWQTEFVLRIDPATGQINSEIDFVGLLPASQRGGEADVMNGIAYDSAHDRLFVTGKNWPTLFEVRAKGR